MFDLGRSFLARLGRRDGPPGASAAGSRPRRGAAFGILLGLGIALVFWLLLGLLLL